MTLRGKGTAVIAILGMNVGVWVIVGLYEFNPLAVAMALVFGLLSALGLGRVVLF